MSTKYKIQIRILTSDFVYKKLDKFTRINGIYKNNYVFLDDLFYEYQKDENGPKIIDIRDFVFEKLVEKRNTCKCCLLFLKEFRSSNYYVQMTNIDDMYFKKTELYKGKDELVIYIKKGENCTCNNLAEYKKVLQARKKQEKEIEELKKTLEEEKKKRR